MNQRGILIVVSGFSGAGKGTLMKELMKRYEETYALSVSATTRNPREGEVDGREYFFKTTEEFEKMIGQQIGISDWLEVTQERINQFADATLDHQWIHVDVERAKVESPFKSTIVHGYLTLSLLPYFWNQIIEVNNLKMMVNYGMDKMRFGQAVLSGQKIRMVADLHSLVNLRGTAKAEIKFAIEIEGQKKKALEGIATFLYYFN